MMTSEDGMSRRGDLWLWKIERCGAKFSREPIYDVRILTGIQHHKLAASIHFTITNSKILTSVPVKKQKQTKNADSDAAATDGFNNEYFLYIAIVLLLL
jgi:hypothetical protein